VRRPIVKIAPLVLLAAGLLFASTASVTANDSIATYRAPTLFTPGWGPANVPRNINYLDGEINSMPPDPNMRPAIDALTAARLVDDRVGGQYYEQNAEIALRVVWFTEENLAQVPTAPYQIQPGEKRLVYVVLQHDHTPAGAGAGGYRPNRLPQPNRPEPRCAVITFVDAITGELVYNGGQVICGYPGQSTRG